MEAEIYSNRGWIKETEEDSLVPIMEKYLRLSGFTILKYARHRFEPQGFTAVWIIAESHLAIHTFPESSKTYFELSSCNKMKNQKFIEMIDHLIIN